MMTNKNTFVAILLTLATLGNVGCSTSKLTSWNKTKNWDLRRMVGLKSNKPEPPQIPERLVCSWTNTVLNKQGEKSKRGFGGRIMFFKHGSDIPVRVEGQLVVYAFDESLGDPEVIHPTRRYIFPKDQFVRHESESELGPSYSVWLPWDVVGGEQKKVSLIARFEPHGGALLVGEQTRHLLPGPTLASKKPANGQQQATNGVQLAQHSKEQNAVTTAAHEEPNKTSEQPTRKMTTSTIPLSSSWQQRLAQRRERATSRTSRSTTAEPLQSKAPQLFDSQP